MMGCGGAFDVEGHGLYGDVLYRSGHSQCNMVIVRRIRPRLRGEMIIIQT